MPVLKPVLAKIDEVDEKYRDLYTQQGEKWVFSGLEGVKTQADIDRLNTAIAAERTAHTKTKTDLKTATDKLAVWEELDPEDVKGKLEKLDTYETGNKVPELAKNFEATVASRVAQVVEGKVKAETTKLQRQLDDEKRKTNELTTQVGDFSVRENTRTVHDSIRAEATKAKVLPEAIGDLLLVAGQELKLVDGRVVTEDGRDSAAVIEDYKAKRPYFWPTAVGAGASGSGPGGGLDGENPFKRENWSQTKIGQLVQKNPAQAAKLAEQAGVPKNPDGSFKYHVMPAAKAA